MTENKHFKNFYSLVMNGELKKVCLPNTSDDYTICYEEKDKKNYIRMINTSFYDDFLDMKVEDYYGI